MNLDKNLQEQLSRLGEQIGSQPSIVDAVMERVAQEAVAPVPRTHRLRRILMKTTMPLAASILVAAVVSFVISQSANTPVYGLQDFERRLAEVRSLHVKGYCMRPTPTGQMIRMPVEFYSQRPMTYWTTYYFGADATATSYRISDGRRYMDIDASAKTCTMGKEMPLYAEMWVEGQLEIFFRQQTAGGLSGFKKTGTEKVKGIAADVYELVQAPRHEMDRAFRFVIHFNPATGWPLRTAGYVRTGGKETLVSEFTDIEPNVPVPAHLFSFEPPAGYQVTQADRKPDEIGQSSRGRAGSLYSTVRFAFNINDQAILMCWACYDTEASPQETDLAGPIGRRLTIVPESSKAGRTYGHYFLRTDPAGEFHWRWSLVVPEGGSVTLDGDEPCLTLRKKGSSHTTIVQPKCLPADRLADILVKAQRLTLPADAPADAVLTLEKLEALIQQIRRQGQARGG